MRVFEVLEDLNLTWEVRDGIRAHCWRIDPPPATAEAICVRYADRIAYLTHDALDAIRAGVLASRPISRAAALERFGEPGRAWVGEMIDAVIEHSLRAGEVRMDAETLAVMNELRDFMFERVYLAPACARTATTRSTSCGAWSITTSAPRRAPATYRDDDADRSPRSPTTWPG